MTQLNESGVNLGSRSMQQTNPISRTLLLACLFALVASGQASPQQTAAAALVVKGDIPAPLSLSAEDLAKMPRETVSILEHDGSKGEYEGVPLREILKRAGAPIEKDLRGKALASYVLAQASDGYQVVFTLAEVAPEFANESILVADKRDGKLMSDHFGPLRLICSNDKVGARSVRMLKTLEVVRLQK